MPTGACGSLGTPAGMEVYNPVRFGLWAGECAGVLQPPAQLGIAAARRCLYTLTAAYFDDEVALEVVGSSNVSQLGLKLVFDVLGAPLQPSKSFAPAPDRHYLGAAIHLGSIATTGCVRIQPFGQPRHYLVYR